jgi:hypothetical protein
VDRYARPDAKTCSNKCRLKLARFRALYGCYPIVPNFGKLQPLYCFERDWFARYLPAEHALNRKYAPVPAPTPKTPSRRKRARRKAK